MRIDRDFVIKWTATAISVVGAICVAVDYYPMGAVMCFLEAGLWLYVSLQMKESFMIASNAVLLFIYTTGMAYKQFLG